MCSRMDWVKVWACVACVPSVEDSEGGNAGPTSSVKRMSLEGESEPGGYGVGGGGASMSPHELGQRVEGGAEQDRCGTGRVRDRTVAE